jgi:hypothetical protein
MVGRSGVGGGFLGDVQSKDKEGPTHVGWRRLAATGVKRSVRGEHGHREQGGAWD